MDIVRRKLTLDTIGTSRVNTTTERDILALAITIMFCLGDWFKLMFSSAGKLWLSKLSSAVTYLSDRVGCKPSTPAYQQGNEGC